MKPSINLMELMPRVFQTESQKYLSDKIIRKLSRPTQGESPMVSTTV